jgi:glycosyltransferase involved in cell wall biosynthesis
MLAYFFPPSKAAGTFRTLRFVRDLPALGWAPTVLTVRESVYQESERDAALLSKVPAGVRVQRTPAYPFHRWYKQALQRAKSFARRGCGPRGGAAGAGGTAAAAREGAVSLRSPLDFVYMLCRTPDVDAGWYWPALLRGLWVVARERPDVLYATGGPWTTFLVARDLARLTRRPLVLDYRDPWTLNPAVVRAGNAFESLALRLERSVVHRARGIVANTDVLRDTLQRAQGTELGDKTVVIHNSYDAADFEGPEPAREDVFTLSYVGAMYEAHDPEPFLQATAALVAERGDLRERLRVRLVGSGAVRVAARVRALGLEDVVRVGEPVPHADAVRLQRSAHVLLLFLTVPSDESTFIPSKLYEYIAANRPILAVTRGGALDRLLRRHQITPWVYRPESPREIAHGILNLLERWERGCLPMLPAATVHGFSGAAAAAALVRVLEAAAARGPMPIPAAAPSTSQPSQAEEVPVA